MKHVEAVYEEGRLRPLEPLELPEGASVYITVLSREEQDWLNDPLGRELTLARETIFLDNQTRPRQTPAEILADIAAQPPEGETEAFSGRDHDEVLYPRK